LGELTALPQTLDGFARGEQGKREWIGLGMERELKWEVGNGEKRVRGMKCRRDLEEEKGRGMEREPWKR